VKRTAGEIIVTQIKRRRMSKEANLKILSDITVFGKIGGVL